MADSSKQGNLTESQAYAKANEQQVPFTLAKAPEGLKGTERFLTPLNLEFDISGINRTVMAKARNIFTAPLKGLPSNPPSLEEIKEHTKNTAKPNPPLDALVDDADVMAAVNRVLNNVDSTTPPMQQHVNKVTEIFKTLAAKTDTLNISALDVKGRANLLISVYYDAEKQLKEQCENDKKALDQWIDANLADLKKVYANEFKNADAKEVIKKNMEARLDAQLKEEIQYLDGLKAAMTSSCDNVNEYVRTIEANHLLQYYNKFSGVTHAKGDEPKTQLPEDGTRYDRYGNAFNVKDKTEIDFKSKEFRGLSDYGKECALYDRMIGLKAAGNSSINMTLSAYDGSSYNWSGKPYGHELARLHWRTAIKAGFEPNKISIAHYNPDQKDLKFHREYRATESYKKLGATNPGLQALFEESAKKDLKKISASSLGPNRAPILTDKEIQEIAAIDFSKVKAPELKVILDKIRPGLGSALSWPNDDIEKIKMECKIRADMIRNPLLREVFKYAKTPDGFYLMEELTSKQIDALNSMDFSRYQTADDVIKAIDRDVFGSTSMHKKELILSEIIDLDATKGLIPFKNTRGEKPTVKNTFFNPQKLDAYGKENQARAIVATKVPELKIGIDKHHVALMGDGNPANTGVLAKIVEHMDWIHTETANAPLQDGRLPNYNYVFKYYTHEGKTQQSLIRNYNEVFWYAEQQLLDLELLRAKLESNGAFKDPAVKEAFQKIYNDTMADIEAAVLCLKDAGKFNNGPHGQLKYDETNQGLASELKRGGNFKKLQALGQQLQDKKEALVRNVVKIIPEEAQRLPEPNPEQPIVNGHHMAIRGK